MNIPISQKIFEKARNCYHSGRQKRFTTWKTRTSIQNMGVRVFLQ
jgi:hypothetical protein